MCVKGMKYSFRFVNSESDEKHSRHVQDNLNKLDANEIKHLVQGVKSVLLSHIEHSELYVDATHADINMGSFFNKLIVREVGQISQWEATSDVKPIIENAEFL